MENTEVYQNGLSVSMGEIYDDFSECMNPPIEDQVNHPNHYTFAGIECIDMMIKLYGVEAVKTYCQLNAFKYLWRCEQKGRKTQDIDKARWYTEKYVELSNIPDTDGRK